MNDEKNSIVRGPRPKNVSGNYYNDLDIHIGTLEVIKCIVSEAFQFFPEVLPNQFGIDIYSLAEIIFCRIPCRTREFLFKNNYPIEDKFPNGYMNLWDHPENPLFKRKLFNKISTHVSFFRKSPNFSFIWTFHVPPTMGYSARDRLDAILEDSKLVISNKQSYPTMSNDCFNVQKYTQSISMGGGYKRSFDQCAGPYYSMMQQQQQQHHQQLLQHSLSHNNRSFHMIDNFNKSTPNSFNMQTNNTLNNTTIHSLYGNNSSSSFDRSLPAMAYSPRSQQQSISTNYATQKKTENHDYYHISPQMVDSGYQPTSPSMYVTPNSFIDEMASPCGVSYQTQFKPSDFSFCGGIPYYKNNLDILTMMSDFKNKEMPWYPNGSATYTNNSMQHNNTANTLNSNSTFSTNLYSNQPSFSNNSYSNYLKTSPTEPNNDERISSSSSFAKSLNTLHLYEEKPEVCGSLNTGFGVPLQLANTDAKTNSYSLLQDLSYTNKTATKKYNW